MSLTEEQISANIQKHMEEQIALIQEHGYTMTSVFSTQEEPGPGFTYTIALCIQTGEDPANNKFGYELVVFGLPASVAAFFLSNIAKMAIEDHAAVFHKAKFLGLAGPTGNLPLYAYDVSDAPNIYEEYVTGPRRYGIEGYKVFQLVWTDKEGRAPWEEGFDEAFREVQPLITETFIKN